MILLQILGWVIFVFLVISIIYSAQFHIRNYMRQKKRINSGEVGEIYKNLHGEIELETIIFNANRQTFYSINSANLAFKLVATKTPIPLKREISSR